MDNEKDLASPNFSSSITGIAATAAVANAARTGPKWMRYLMFVFIAITAFATIAGLVGKIGGVGSIPVCDAQTTRDTLSDLNRQNKFNASKYNFIKSVATTDTGVTCTANLALWGGGHVEYDYRIYKEAGSVKVQITQVRK